MSWGAKCTRVMSIAVVVLGVAFSPWLSAGASAASPPAPKSGMDTALATGTGSFFTRIDIHAQSTPSGQSPSGHVSFVLSGGLPVSGPVTCMHVTGPDEGAGTVGSPTDAVLNARTSQFGIVTIKLVDHGGNGADTMSAIPTPRSPTDCSAFNNGITEALTHGGATVFDAHPPNIFAVVLKSCVNLHVGYNYFPAGIVVHWRVNQTGTGTLATGSFTTLTGGRTYHFLTMPLGVTLQPDSRSTHTHVRFTWTIGTATTHYEATRDPGCEALDWTSPSTIRVGVPARFASVDPCPPGTAGVAFSIVGPGGGFGSLGGFPGFPVATNGSWSANVTLPDDVGAPTTTTAVCNSNVRNAPPLATYATHPITVAP
jgi:hypothetical protein